MGPASSTWLTTRSAAVLAHISSLPGGYGIGNLGPGARRLVDFLGRAGVRYWQICPIGPTGYGDSPYQTFSGHAGNPYFIDLGELVGAMLDGTLDEALASWAAHRRWPSDGRRGGAPPGTAGRARRLRPPVRGILAGACAGIRPLRRIGRRRPGGLRVGVRFPQAKRRLAGALRRLHGAQGPLRRAAVDGVARGIPKLDPRAARNPCGVGAARRRPPRLLSAPFLRPMGAAAAIRGVPRRRDHWRRADLRRARQRGHVAEPRGIPAGWARAAARGSRGASRLFLRDGPALGQPALRLGSSGPHRLRLVD